MAIIVAYLMLVRGKSRATTALAANMAAAMVFSGLELMLTSSFSPHSYAYNPLIYSMALVFCTTALWFAYEYLADIYPTEKRVVITASGLVAAGFLGWSAVELLNRGARYDLPLQAVGYLAVVQYAVIVTVFLRKRRMILGGGLQSDAGADMRFALPADSAAVQASAEKLRSHRASACVSFSVFLLLILFVSASSMLRDAGLYSSTVNVIVIVVCLLLYSGGFVIVYLLHGPESSTFQVKLIGLTLMAVFMVLSLLPLALVPEHEIADDDRVSSPPAPVLRFTPLDGGAYQVRPALRAAPSPAGEPLEMGRATYAAVPIGFPFPLFGRTHDSVHVSLYGYAVFGREAATLVPNHIGDFLMREPAPLLAPYAMDADKGQRREISILRAADSAVITWSRLQFYGTMARSSFRLVLYRDGRFEYRYDTINAPGVIVAQDGDPTERETRRADADTPFLLAAGTRLRIDTHETFLALLHGKHLPIAWMLAGTALFVIVVFPRFYRSGLIAPLEALLYAVESVDHGRLDAWTPVVIRDEIGHVSASFNRMTHSLRDAQQQLRAYADNLEELVRERTAKLEAAQKQLVQQEKLASLGQLTAGIAHEIKNPLNFINNFASGSARLLDDLDEALRDAAQGDTARAGEAAELVGELRESVSRIRAHGGRVDAIVTNMMQHSRGEDEARKPTDINEFLRQAAHMATLQLRESAPDAEPVVTFELDDEAGSVEAVRPDLLRLFINVMLNGLQASVEYAHSGAIEHPALTVRSEMSADGAVVHISDNGPGIPDDIRGRIFQPFFTTKAAGVGTGLGLSLAHDIAVAHGATIELESASGESAMFVIRFPKEDSERTAEESAAGREG